MEVVLLNSTDVCMYISLYDEETLESYLKMMLESCFGPRIVSIVNWNDRSQLGGWSGRVTIELLIVCMVEFY